MAEFEVVIVRMVDEANPGFVECEFVDAHGRSWQIVEKMPVVTAESLAGDSRYPAKGFIECEELSRRKDGAGRTVVRVTTELPWHIEAVTGDTQFELWLEQLR